MKKLQFETGLDIHSHVIDTLGFPAKSQFFKLPTRESPRSRTIMEMFTSYTCDKHKNKLTCAIP